MAVIESKRSSARTQPATRKTLKSKKPTNVPPSLRFTETKRGKTTIRRYPGRSFYRFEEAKGKAIDYIEFFTMGEYNSIDIAFEDKTAVHFVIEPRFTLETEYADWKSGDWRPIKQWPPIHSQSDRM
jgi:hypothetical protein